MDFRKASGFSDFDPPQGYKPVSTMDYDDDGVFGRRSNMDSRDSFDRNEDRRDTDRGGYGGGGGDSAEVTHFICSGAKVFQSYDSTDLTNEDYEKRTDLSVKVSFRDDCFKVFSDYGYGYNDGEYYNYKEIKKINHKRGPQGNFLNLILANNKNLCFCTPESANLKATMLDFIKKKSNLRVADYRSNHD